jgi:hypothetical protein
MRLAGQIHIRPWPFPCVNRDGVTAAILGVTEQRPNPQARAHVYGVGVGVGDAATTVKFTVIVAPLVPVPPVPLHGVAAKVWFPIEVGVNVESKGVAESVFTTAPSLLNTTLRVLAFACAVTV